MSGSTSAGKRYVAEFVGTFILVAIGATVFAGALVTGPLTGGSFNPARTLGPAVVGNLWTAHWIYWLAPITGMVAAMRLYEAIRGPGAPATATTLIAGT